MAYLTLRRLGSEISARFGTLLLVLFYGLTSSANFLHYSGELLPALLINIGFYFVVRLLGDSLGSRLRNGNLFAFLGGLALGAAPWCKLQAAPISASLALFALVAIWSSRRQPLAERAWHLRTFALVAGLSLDEHNNARNTG